MKSIPRLIAIIICLIFVARSEDYDRQISPTRGFQPAHSYSIDDIESIDKGTGSLSLHIPITQLPPGPAGFTAGVVLSYNSRYWNAEEVSSTNIEYDLQYHQAGGGGWRLSMTPHLDYEIVPQLSPSDPCQSGVNNDVMRLSMVNQDGSRNLLYRSSPAVTTLPQCAGTYWISQMNTGQSTWFTADGSFLRLVIGAPITNVEAPWPANSPWTLYRLDGSKVTFVPSTRTDGITTLYDKNGNTITITHNEDYEEMKDPYERLIRIDHHKGIPFYDTITQIGHGEKLTWTVNWTTFPAITEPTSFRSQPQGNGTLDLFMSPAPMLVSSLDLPNRRSYSFSYLARYRELSDITLPTGATVHYTYRLDGTSSAVHYYHILANTVASKTVTHDSTSESWFYTYDVSLHGVYSVGTMTAPDGGRSEYEFYPVSYQYGALPLGGTLKRIVNPDGSQVLREWAFNNPVELPNAAPVFPNQWIQRELTTVANATPSTLTAANQTLNLIGTPTATSIRVYAVDKNGNRTSEEERDWVAYSTSPPASSDANLLRQTKWKYVNGADDSASGDAKSTAYSHPSATTAPKNLVASSELQTQNGTVKARHQFTYTAAGNVEHEYHWDDTKKETIASDEDLSAHNQEGKLTSAIGRSYTYTPHGNLSSESDELGHLTQYGYEAATGCYADLYRTSMTKGGTGTIARTVRYEYNAGTYNSQPYNACKSGMRTKIKDANNVEVFLAYDKYSRPIAFDEGGQRKTTHEYDDQNLWIVTRTDAVSANDQKKVSVLKFDQLGRVKQSRQLDTEVEENSAAVTNNLAIVVDTKYVFADGRNDVLVSNPYHDSTEASAPTRGWTVTRRDKAGRVCLQETFAGAAEPAVAINCDASTGTTGKTLHTYSMTVGLTTKYRWEKISDAVNSTRTLAYDVLGRLTGVVEDPSTLRYATYYGYDINDNLTSVRQAGSCSETDPINTQCAGGLTRTFAYSTLKRLTSAANLESEPILYRYDDAGNLVRRQQAGVIRCAGTSVLNGVCQGSGYDDLNRIVAQSYNDGTPAVSFSYDAEVSPRPTVCASAGAPIGRLSSVSNSNSTTSYYYNALGQPLCSRQAPASGSSDDFSYTMSPEGVLKSMKYPSGRVVNATLDVAGRVTGVAGSKSYATSIQYASHGAMKSLTLGNGLVETWTYNSRLQPTKIEAGGLLTIVNCYQSGDDTQKCAGLSGSSTNNGNLLRQSISRGTNTWTQNFTYDALNRLKSAAESGAGTWTESYGFDAAGNRWVCAHSGTGIPDLTLETPSNPGDCNSSAWFYGNNQVKTWQYDRGSVKDVASMSRSFTYDGESRQISAVINGQTSTYAYDGEGRRVKAVTSAGTSRFVYDAFGQLAVEYGPVATGETQYITTDHLGSTRLISTGTSAPVTFKDSDYMPFGQELSSGIGGAARGATFDGLGNRLKFTGKERDAETGLDYFGARYFSGAQGRFTSPDAPFADQRPEDPQSWNLYSYVRNNPLRYIDDDGRGARELWFGITNAVSSNAGAVRRVSSSDSDVRRGQRIGDVVSFAGGLIEMAGGGTMSAGGAAACGTGVLCVAGAPAVVGGAAVAAHGAMLTGNATVNLMSPSDDAPGSGGSGEDTPDPKSKPEAIVGQIKEGGFKVQQNPKTGTQEGNVSISHPSQPGTRVNIRIETHPLKPGGPPVRHANVEVVKPGPKNRPRVVENIHIDK